MLDLLVTVAILCLVAAAFLVCPALGFTALGLALLAAAAVVALARHTPARLDEVRQWRS